MGATFLAKNMGALHLRTSGVCGDYRLGQETAIERVSLAHVTIGSILVISTNYFNYLAHHTKGEKHPKVTY
jgi:hypothetical protein